MAIPYCKKKTMDLQVNLVLEPFYGGSHKQLIDILTKEIENCELFSLPAKKWHWKARTSALYFSQIIPVSHQYSVLFASSVLNLAELVALRPDLASIKKIVYFHENQLVYPIRKQQDRDFQYGYNQILTCLVADVIVFNSSYNMESFLSSISSFLKMIPDHRPKNVEQTIRPKCKVLYFPLQFHEHCDSVKDVNHPSKELLSVNQSNESKINVLITEKHRSTKNSLEEPNLQHERKYTNRTEDNCQSKNFGMKSTSVCEHDNIDSSMIRTEHTENLSTVYTDSDQQRTLHILWAHRWEHDKDPDTFFEVLYQLNDNGINFKLSILGESFTDVPEIFAAAKEKLKNHIVNWGYLENKEDYYNVLRQANVSVSTALHEFFGVSMLESVYYGCFPLCPNRLVYPEIFPGCCLYNTSNQLYKQLRDMCKHPHLVNKRTPKINMEKYAWSSLKDAFINLFSIT